MMSQKGSHGNYPNASVAWITVAVLSFTYMFSFMDRQILVLLIEPIKQDLQLSDTQVSLLTGLSFALVYSFTCIPMGRAADLWIRKYVIMLGVTVWSLLTIACGFSRNFWQLFFARMGVGFGEAALTPTAYAMIADLFPPNRLARGLSVFGISGIAAGGAMPLIIGGLLIGSIENAPPLVLPLVGELRNWQTVLIVAGLLSLLMVIPLSLIREPQRHRSEVNENVAAKDQSFRDVLLYIWRQKSLYGPLILAGSIAAMGAYGVGAWWPSYFIRVHQWSAETAGITLGSLYLVPAVLGGLSAGGLADYYRDKGCPNGILYLSIASMLSLAVLIPAVIAVPSLTLKMVLLAVMNFSGIGYALLLPTIIQLLTPNQMRGQVSAIFLLAVSLLGLGLGPSTVALLTDYIFHNELAVGKSIAVVGMLVFGMAAVALSFMLKPIVYQRRALCSQ